jgi:polygalacturonase
MNYSIYIVLLIITFPTGSAQAQMNGIWNVTDFGAKGDGLFINTSAIQATIDQASLSGGGIVWFPPGQYVSGSVILKDYITLHLEPGAILLGSLDMNDYPSDLGVLRMNEQTNFAGPLIYAEKCRYIGIEGHGIIDGRGLRENFEPLPASNLRPGLVRFKDCSFVNVKDVTLRNSARWTFHLRNCEDVSIHNIRLNSNVNRNNDGIDVDGGKRISIVGCNISAEDDAIVFKSFTREDVTDIVIADCILNSTCSAIKIGTETVGNFRNISISNCVIFGSRGINLYSVDGSDINNVIISNISLRDCKSVIQIRLGARLRAYDLPKDQQFSHAGRIRNIMIRNIQATGVMESQDFISGIPGRNLENIDLSDIRIQYFGTGSLEQARRDIPEEVTKYPKIDMFGDLPSYGFFIRHVDGIRLNNIKTDHINPDLRPAIFFDDVSGINMRDCLFKGHLSGESLIRLNNINDALITQTRSSNDIYVFVKISGESTKNIILKDNLLLSTKRIIERSKEVKKSEIKEID